MLADKGFETAASSQQQIVLKPPFLLLNLTVLLGLVSAALFFLDSRIGYLIGTVASVSGGLVVFMNLKRMGDQNYVSFSWFIPVLRSVRYVILLITISHIVKLAIDAATGATLW